MGSSVSRFEVEEGDAKINMWNWWINKYYLSILYAAARGRP